MLWTPAHFWALALLLREDYRSVGIPMLPVVKGEAFTARAIGRYAWATVLLSGVGVVALPSGGFLYGLLVLPFNGRLLQLSAALGAIPPIPAGPGISSAGRSSTSSGSACCCCWRGRRRPRCSTCRPSVPCWPSTGCRPSDGPPPGGGPPGSP